MKQICKKVLSLILVCALLFNFTACGKSVDQIMLTDLNENIFNDQINNQNDVTDVATDAHMEDNTSIVPDGDYVEGVVLVKFEEEFDASVLGELKYSSAEPIYVGAKWYVITLSDGMTTIEAVEYLSSLETVDEVDFDYIVEVDSFVDVSCNPNYGDHDHHHTHKVPDGWNHIGNMGYMPGGTPDVVIAVIDTGVDYSHLDLRNNIWINAAEIPDNGVDDDGNGYIDDTIGWDCVGDENDPMDDNGHGTHVAGIIAAENNNIGGVGIAYGCRVMVIKAGNSSGYFNSSDIAEAIQYAYMNGASVINMSFGGSTISRAVEEALEEAYTNCILVAAAGNEGLCNQPDCPVHDDAVAFYPAALPYVIGVMSVNPEGTIVSGFSNYDHYPYNGIEYEVYAVGEAVNSTWPGNKYAPLNGTSMAAPSVSAIAGLLRSAYPDRAAYSTKFIQSQIVNTGSVNPLNLATEGFDVYHTVTNTYEALTNLPKPEVNLYDYYISDDVSISTANNGNGVIDAGETVRLYIELHNRGGVASNVNVTIDTLRNGEFTDPYFTLVNTSMYLSDIGTYSVRESGENYFEIIVASNCPNDYLTDFNIRYTYNNGMDASDWTEYYGEGTATFNVSNGYHLEGVISEDTVFTNDRRYIVGGDLIIPEGVTVTFTEGCEIQFYDDREYYNSPVITVYGTLNFLGTQQNMVKIYPSEKLEYFACSIVVDAYKGNMIVDYCDIVNGSLAGGYYSEQGISITNSYLRHHGNKHGTSIFGGVYTFKNGNPQYSGETSLSIRVFCNNFGEFVGIDTDADCNNNFLVNAGGGYCEPFSNNIVHSIKYSSSPGGIRFDGTNNKFIAYTTADMMKIELYHKDKSINNYFSPIYRQYAADVIYNYLDASGNPTVDVYGSCSDESILWPHIVDVSIFNSAGEKVDRVGTEEVTVQVTFNRQMDTTQETYATFGTIEPYGDYRIDGEYISDTVWQGKYTLKSQIENGQNYLQIHNACQAGDITKVVFGKYQLHEFTIDTTAAMSMNLQAIATDEGINLTWIQDDYDTLMGYNIYRSEDKDGNFVKINPVTLLSTDSNFLDDNIEPGKTYWYTFTVVLSDFTESAPAGKISCMAKDTILPTAFHTPVNQAYEGNNLVISCTATDNMAISYANLCYRTVGAEEWNLLPMTKTNDKYSATIFGSEVTLAGIEYYMIISDGSNFILKGTPEAPYTVVVKEASVLAKLGDVDGNGIVSTKDALMLMQCLNDELILTDDQFKRADLNGDGILSSVEALRILQYINGKVTSLEM